MLCKLIFCFCMTVGGNVNVCNLVPWQSKDRWCLNDRWSRLVYRVFKVLSQNIRCTQYVTHMQLRYISIACVWHTVWFRVQIESVTPAHNINSNEVIFHKISFVFIAWLTRVAIVFLCMCETCLFYSSCMFTAKQGNLLNGYRQAKETAVMGGLATSLI